VGDVPKPEPESACHALPNLSVALNDVVCRDRSQVLSVGGLVVEQVVIASRSLVAQSELSHVPCASQARRVEIK